jgi:hypothetical protein
MQQNTMSSFFLCLFVCSVVTESTEGGTFNHIQTAEDIGEAFGGCLGSLLSVVAQNITLKIVPGLNCKISTIHGHLRMSDSGSDGKEIEIGDSYAEARKDILIDIELRESLKKSIKSNCCQVISEEMVSHVIDGVLLFICHV